MSKNPFILDMEVYPHTPDCDTELVHEHNEEASQQEDPLDRERHLARFDAQIITMIAITASPARWLWEKQRKAAFDAAMQQMKFYLGLDGCANCPYHECEFSLFCQFLRQLLRL